MSERISVTVNGLATELNVEPRELLVDVLRNRLLLTGTHAACEHGACGACTVLVDGEAVLSCLTLGVQADGRSVTTVEGLTTGEELHPLQQAFSDAHALQCGFCTPGMLMAALDLLQRTPRPDPDAVAAALTGNLCRCTGYTSIVDAVISAAEAMSAAGGRPQPEPEPSEVLA